MLAYTFYPGWQATLDGTPVEILRANHAFRAVVFPPGEHIVVFRYAPLSFHMGGAISLLSLIAVMVGLAVLRPRRAASHESALIHTWPTFVVRRLSFVLFTSSV